MSDSLGGNVKPLMFVDVSPTDFNLEETQNSLEYATRVRSIKNEAVKNSAEATSAFKRKITFWKCITTEEVDNILNDRFRSIVVLVNI